MSDGDSLLTRQYSTIAKFCRGPAENGRPCWSWSIISGLIYAFHMCRLTWGQSANTVRGGPVTATPPPHQEDDVEGIIVTIRLIFLASSASRKNLYSVKKKKGL